MIPTLGYAARSATTPFGPFNFERRNPGAEDVRIDILFCGVCHSDLHTARGEWGGTVYPCVPGHEIVGRVVEVGRRMGRKNVRTDDPVERIDTKILEVVLALERADGLVPGLRLMAYLEAAPVPSARPPATPSTPHSAGGR